LVIFVMYVSLCKSCSDVPFSIQKKVVIWHSNVVILYVPCSTKCRYLHPGSSDGVGRRTHRLQWLEWLWLRRHRFWWVWSTKAVAVTQGSVMESLQALLPWKHNPVVAHHHESPMLSTP
jgi:hypothetical protein